jgi:hypothetical protein
MAGHVRVALVPRRWAYTNSAYTKMARRTPGPVIALRCGRAPPRWGSGRSRRKRGPSRQECSHAVACAAEDPPVAALGSSSGCVSSHRADPATTGLLVCARWSHRGCSGRRTDLRSRLGHRSPGRWLPDADCFGHRGRRAPLSPRTPDTRGVRLTARRKLRASHLSELGLRLRSVGATCPRTVADDL